MLIKCTSRIATPHAAIKLERGFHGELWVSVFQTNRNGLEVQSEPIKVAHADLLAAITAVMEPGNEKP
jgi:hypothetical protein